MCHDSRSSGEVFHEALFVRDCSMPSPIPPDRCCDGGVDMKGPEIRRGRVSIVTSIESKAWLETLKTPTSTGLVFRSGD